MSLRARVLVGVLVLTTLALAGLGGAVVELGHLDAVVGRAVHRGGGEVVDALRPSHRVHAGQVRVGELVVAVHDRRLLHQRAVGVAHLGVEP